MRIVFQNTEQAASIARAADRVSTMIQNDPGIHGVEIIGQIEPEFKGGGVEVNGEGFRVVRGRASGWCKLIALVKRVEVVDL